MYDKLKFLLLIFLFNSLAYAQVDLEVPSSRIATESYFIDMTPPAMEFFASSINYLRLDSSKWSQNTPHFSPDSPFIGVNYVNAGERYDYIFGFGAAAFRRWGETEVRGPVLKNEQIGYLARLRAGYRHHIFQNQLGKIYGGISILPTMFFATESPLGPGETISSFPTQISLGGSLSVFTLEGFLENFNEPGFSAGVRIEL